MQWADSAKPLPPPAVRLYVVAFSGESGLLADTLQSLSNGAESGDIITRVVGSDDPALRLCAERSGLDFSPDLPEREQPDHFWTTLLQVLHPTLDYSLVLRAGCEVPPYWIRRLCTVALRSGATAVFPLSVRHPCTSAFSSVEHLPRLGVHAVDRWLNRYSPGLEFDIPLLAGYCGLFLGPWYKPDANSDDNQLAGEWRNNGALMIATDAVYIDDSALPALSLPKNIYPAWQESFIDRHPLTEMRHALSELSARGEVPPQEVANVRPVRLHISHSWGGGLGRWVEDFTGADTTHQSLVLRPIGHWDAFSQTLALYPSARMDVPLKSWTLAQPILSTALCHFQYTQILREILDNFAVQSILVSSLIGHSLDVLKTGRPTTFVCHDFYPACPPLYATWGNPCTHCDATHMANCLQHNPLHRIFRVEAQPHWLALRKEFVSTVVQGDIAMVAPCRSVAQRLKLILPGLADKDITVIEHGLSSDLIGNLDAVRKPAASSTRLRIVILGSLSEHKGAAVLSPVLSQITAFADLILLGAGEHGRRFKGLAGLTVIDHYQRDQLGALLAQHAPHIGLLLSTVPETFSYTLSELHVAGIPVAATDMGAFADRIIHDQNGWLFAPQPVALLALLEKLRDNPVLLDEVRHKVRSQPIRNSATMVADYNKLEGQSLSLFTPLSRPCVGQHLKAADYLAHGHLHIDHQAPFRQVLRDFIHYTFGKVRRTPRLPGGVKKIASFLLGRLLK